MSFCRVGEHPNKERLILDYYDRNNINVKYKDFDFNLSKVDGQSDMVFLTNKYEEFFSFCKTIMNDMPIMIAKNPDAISNASYTVTNNELSIFLPNTETMTILILGVD